MELYGPILQTNSIQRRRIAILVIALLFILVNCFLSLKSQGASKHIDVRAHRFQILA